MDSITFIAPSQCANSAAFHALAWQGNMLAHFKYSPGFILCCERMHIWHVFVALGKHCHPQRSDKHCLHGAQSNIWLFACV